MADQGKGMTADEHERAFGDFVQGDGSDTRPYGGLGLGLAMVKRVAEAHGGHVDVVSEPKKGRKVFDFPPGGAESAETKEAMRRWVCCRRSLVVSVRHARVQIAVAACGPGPTRARLAQTQGPASTHLGVRPGRRSSTAAAPSSRATRSRFCRARRPSSFGDNRRIELRRGAAVKVDTVPARHAGDALLVAARARRCGSRPPARSLAVADGVARVSRGLGFEAAAYPGHGHRDLGGPALTIAALRRATFAALGVMPSQVDPSDCAPTDAWDRHYLGDRYGAGVTSCRRAVTG